MICSAVECVGELCGCLTVSLGYEQHVPSTVIGVKDHTKLSCRHISEPFIT
jgi:hypothetical protein